jgi:hypothetical protein
VWLHLFPVSFFENALYFFRKTLHNQESANYLSAFFRAKALGMERPKLCNQMAITNYNSMIYLLTNLQAIKRVLRRLSPD